MTARALVLWSEPAAVEALGATDLPASFRAGTDQSLRESDRRLRLLGRLLLARALERIAGLPLPDLSFDPLGRPRLTGALDPSISHTDGLACAAVGIGCRIGVDVERLQPIEAALHDRILAPGERRIVDRSDDADRAFLGFWTMKEAAAKADGRGLQLEPKHLLCRPASRLRAGTVQVEAEVYRVRALPLPSGWIGHLAHDGAALELAAEAYSFS